jgi:hypothetical protein
MTYVLTATDDFFPHPFHPKHSELVARVRQTEFQARPVLNGLVPGAKVALLRKDGTRLNATIQRVLTSHWAEDDELHSDPGDSSILIYFKPLLRPKDAPVGTHIWLLDEFD